MLILNLSILILVASVTVQATPGLVLPAERTTGLGCIPEGETVIYECTVTATAVGRGATIWQGSAFMCTGADSISLVHSTFESGAMSVCGDLSAMSVGVNETEYTSRLTFIASLHLNGTTIECTRGALVVVGSDTILVGGVPPPPQQLTFTANSPSSLTVSWSPPSDVSNVARYRFNVTGDCGHCTEVTNTSQVCSGWQPNGQNCFFEVRSISRQCELLSDQITVHIHLKVPSTPTNLLVSTVYSELGFIEYVDVEFIAGRVSGTDFTTSYTVMFTSATTTLQFTQVTCNVTNHCSLRLDSQQLTTSDRYIVSVVASNIFGSGLLTSFPTPVQLCRTECDLEVFGSSPSSQIGPGSIAVTNGVVTYNGVIPGSVATVQCDSDYIPGDNVENRTCQSSGHWSEGTLSCVQSSTTVATLSNEVSIAIAVMVTFLLTLVLGVSIGALGVWGYYKCRRSDHVTLQPPTEMSTPAVIYEEPEYEDIHPDPHTEGNLAYGHFQTRQ